ncbi:hypothetical protein ACWC2K_24525 [Streptomyces chattanoogensis]
MKACISEGVHQLGRPGLSDLGGGHVVFDGCGLVRTVGEEGMHLPSVALQCDLIVRW